MADLLEDPDGAPYPQEVQDFRSLVSSVLMDWGGYWSESMDESLVKALESVAEVTYDNGWEDGMTGGELHERGGPSPENSSPHRRSHG